jgi:hypothetical protein
MRTKFVEVIDDFLDKSYFDFIVNDVMSDDNFPWYYSDDASYAGSPKYTVNGTDSNRQGFSNLLVENDKPNDRAADQIYPFALKVKSLLGARKVLRVRADMCLQSYDECIHGPHVDYPGQFHYSSILYLNETDGNTIIFNERDTGVQINNSELRNFTVKESIEPKPNRLVIFDGRYVHTGCSPTEHKCRKLLNSNYQ